MTAKLLRHKFKSALADTANDELVQPSDWNDEHDLWLGFREVNAPTDAITLQDHLSILRYDDSGTVNLSLPGDLPPGFKVKVFNAADGILIVIPSLATINGSNGIFPNAVYALRQGQMLELLRTDTSDYIGIFTRGRRPSDGLRGEWGQRLITGIGPQLIFTGRFIKHCGAVAPFEQAFPPSMLVPGGIRLNLLTDVKLLNGVDHIGPLAPNTPYYVCLSVRLGEDPRLFHRNLMWNFIPLGSGNTHGPSTMPGNEGVAIVGAPTERGSILSNNASLIGMVYTTDSGGFADESIHRYIASWFNRRWRHLTSNHMSNYQTASTSGFYPPYWNVNFLSWGDTPVLLRLAACQVVNTIHAHCYMLIMVDMQPVTQNAGHFCTNGLGFYLSNGAVVNTGPGRHYAGPWTTVSGGVGSFYCTVVGLCFI